VPTRRPADVEDIWLFLHLLFEKIWQYRFFYRDLNDLLTRNRLLEIHFKQNPGAQGAHGEDPVRRSGVGRCDARHTGELRALATNMTVIATYWLSFEYVAIRAADSTVVVSGAVSIR
jgi:hypothetical protein